MDTSYYYVHLTKPVGVLDTWVHLEFFDTYLHHVMPKVVKFLITEKQHSFQMEE